MTSKAGHTAGPCEFHTQPYDCRSWNGLDHSIMDDDGVVIFVVPPGPANEEFQKRGHFIAGAFNVAHETGLTPRQLAERCEKLEAALVGVTDLYCELANSGDAGFWNPEKVDEVITARALLAKATAGGA